MLTQKQEAFVIKFLECDNAAEAYRHAYDTQNQADTTIYPNASRLLRNSKVLARIQEVKDKVLNTMIIDKKFITEGILRNIEVAESREDNNVALKGYDMLGKMYDLNEDKQNDRLFTGAERLALVENYKKRLLDVTPE